MFIDRKLNQHQAINLERLLKVLPQLRRILCPERRTPVRLGDRNRIQPRQVQRGHVRRLLQHGKLLQDRVLLVPRHEVHQLDLVLYGCIDALD